MNPPASQSPVVATPRPRALILGAYSAALAALGMALFLYGVDRHPPLPGDLSVPWWAVAIAFVVAERMLAHVHVGRESHSFSLSEVPLVVGLALVSPIGLLAARWVGGLVALVSFRRPPFVKIALNLSVFTLEVGVAVPVYRALLGGASVVDQAGWIAAFAAGAASAVAGNVAVIVAMSLWSGSREAFSVQRLVTPLIAGLSNTSLALLSVIVLSVNTAAFWLLLQVVVLLLMAYRAYAALHTRHQGLQSLHEFTQLVGGGTEATGRPMLEQLRALMRAEAAEVLLFDEDRQHAVRVRLTGDDTLDTQMVDLACPLHLEVAAGADPVVVARNPREQWQRQFLAAHGVIDAIVAPLRGDRVSGTVMAGSRYRASKTFDAHDVRLFDTIASHISMAVENGRLVDRLVQEAQEKEYQGSHDLLTGLLNRACFTREVDELIAADPRRDLAVVLVDLDRFKEVNDTLGHHTGDALLVEVSSRLRATLGSGAVIARFGGDEFAIALPRIGGPHDAVSTAKVLLDALRRRFDIGDFTLDIAGSIGVALYGVHGADADVLVQRADVAMYVAKGAHSGVELYDPERDEHSRDRLALVGDLRAAVERGALDVHYQPKADIRSSRVVGVEALVRWNHPQRGWIAPDQFIPIAERTGLIAPLTLFVLERSLMQCRAWRRAGHADMTVAVNLSVNSLLNLEFPADVERLLSASGMPADALTLEITESTIMADPERAITVLRILDSMGVTLAVDDFGTGYSSLSQLKRLPVSELKIDRSFVMSMATAADDEVIVRSTIDLGRNLGLTVVAEGIEDARTWQRLAAFGCDVAQGYYFSRPQPADALNTWLAQRRTQTRALIALGAE